MTMTGEVTLPGDFYVPPPFYVGDSQFIDLYQLCHSMAESMVVTRIDGLLPSSVVCWVNIPPLWGIKVRSPTYLSQQVYLTLSRSYKQFCFTPAFYVGDLGELGKFQASNVKHITSRHVQIVVLPPTDASPNSLSRCFMSRKIKLAIFGMLFMFVAATASECSGPNLIDQIVSNPGHCPAESWGGHCDN